MKVPPLLPRFVALPDGERFVPLEQVIAAHLGPARSRACTWSSTTRSGSPATPTSTLEEDEADDLLAAVEMELRRRRFGRAVRLEVEDGMPRACSSCSLRELDLDRGRRLARGRRSTSAACGRCTASTAPT